MKLKKIMKKYNPQVYPRKKRNQLKFIYSLMIIILIIMPIYNSYTLNNPEFQNKIRIIFLWLMITMFFGLFGVISNIIVFNNFSRQQKRNNGKSYLKHLVIKFGGDERKKNKFGLIKPQDTSFFDEFTLSHISIHIFLTLVFFYINSNFVLSVFYSIIFSLSWELFEFIFFNLIGAEVSLEAKRNVLSDIFMAFIGSFIAYPIILNW